MSTTTAQRTAEPIILVTTAHPSLHQHAGPAGESVHPRLGRLLQPRHVSSVELTAEAGIPWACDNDCFQALDDTAFLAMIDRVAGLPGCLFVTVPDVVGDAAATLARFEDWAPELEARGLPVGLVAQDGMTLDDLDELAPRLAALFIGGSTEWKLGDEAAELAREAKRRGLWVHWGRVNSRKRIRHIIDTGAADSFDGTKYARFRNTYLSAELSYLDDLAATTDVELDVDSIDQEVTVTMSDVPTLHGPAAVFGVTDRTGKPFPCVLAPRTCEHCRRRPATWQIGESETSPAWVACDDCVSASSEFADRTRLAREPAVVRVEGIGGSHDYPVPGAERQAELRAAAQSSRNLQAQEIERAAQEPSEQRVTIVGPNLTDQSQGSFHVHAAGCADLKRNRNLRNAEQWTMSAASLTDVCDAVYPPEDFECESGEYLHDFHVAPCVHLPTTTPEA